MAQQLETGPLQIQHGHTDNQVIIMFTGEGGTPRLVDHVTLTPDQVDRFIAAVQNSKKMLLEHLANPKPAAPRG